MRRIVKATVVFMAVLSCMVTSTYAEESPAFEVTADLYSKYIWRGQNLFDEAAFQPGASVSYAGFTAGIWASMETTNLNGNSGDFTEVDYSLDYSGQVPGFEAIGFSVGAISYEFPNTGVDGTVEVYWGFSADLPLSPSITVYHDVDEAEGTYLLLSAGHSVDEIFKLASDTPVALEVSASLGWGDSAYNEFYWSVTDGELNDFVLSVSLPTEIAGFTVTPSVSYVTLVGSDVSNSNTYDTDDNYFFAGIGLSKSF